MEFVWWYILHNSTEAFRSKGSKWLLLHRIDLEQQYPRDVANPFKYLHSKASAFAKCTCCECPKTALFPGQIPHGNEVLIERYSVLIWTLIKCQYKKKKSDLLNKIHDYFSLR